MTPKQVRKLIDSAGGTKAFALRLGIATPGYPSRIGRWKERGFPEGFIDQHRAIIGELRQSAAQRGIVL